MTLRLTRFYFSAENLLDRATARNEVDHENDQSDNQKKVNQTAADVTDETQKPQHQKHHDNCPKHLFILLLRTHSNAARKSLGKLIEP